jgi:hypothetical protein
VVAGLIGGLSANMYTRAAAPPSGDKN